MKKKLFAVLLAAAMTISAVACGSQPANNAPAETKAEETKADAGKEDTPAASEEVTTDPSEWPVIKVEICSFTDTLAAEPQIEAALNDYLVSINAGVQCDMLPIAIGDRSTTLTLMLADNNNPIDLFAWRWYSTVSDLVKNDQCISLEQYRDVYPDLFDLFPEAVYKTCQVNGEQYSIPGADSFGNFQVYAMRKDVVDEVGYTDKIGTKLTMDEFEDLLAKAEAAHPELCWHGDTNVVPLQGIDTLGDANYIGVLLNSGIDQTEIVNYYETEDFKNYVTMTKEWADKGYIVNDPLNTNYAGYTLVNDNMGGGYMYEGYSIPYSLALMQAQIASQEMCVFQLTDPACTNSCVYNGWQISTVCKNPDAAMKLLYLMYTDETVCRYFTLGIEGEQYVLDENGCAWYPEGVDVNTCGWNCSAPWFYPNECLSAPFETDYAEYYSGMVDFWVDPANKFSNGMGFVFDNTAVFDQVAACRAIVDEYREALYMGQVDVDEYLTKFNEELKKNGIDEIIEEMNRQFQEFLAQ